MRVKYLYNRKYYVLSNFSAGSGPLFISREDVQNFKKRVMEHLGELCEIKAYSFRNDQYKILVHLKSRVSFIEFFKKKKQESFLSDKEVPASTYIISQEMANIQSGYAKWFNHKYYRYGGLFSRRFTKIYLRTASELKKWIRRIQNGFRIWRFNRFWSYRHCYIGKWEGLIMIDEREVFKEFSQNDLRGKGLF